MPEQPNTLGKFLIKLSEDATLKSDFKKDPKAVMLKEGLNEKERTAVLSGNSRTMTAALSKAAGIKKPGIGGLANAGGGDNVVTVVVVVVVVI